VISETSKSIPFANMLHIFQRNRIAFLIALLVLTACDRSVVFEEHYALPSIGWHLNDKVVFEVPVNDTTSLHNLYIDVRNTTDYGYRNFYMFLEIKFPEGTILRDTIECLLADRTGQWAGKGFGKIRSNRFLFRTDVWFPEPGNYVFSIEQAMRNEVLEGISDVGLRIERK
jgi:gliding motility-associated lipoprotein GldH